MKRWRSIAAVVLVFLCGGAVGSMVTMKGVRGRVRGADRLEASVHRGWPRLARALALSAEQREAIQPILLETARELRGLRGRVLPEMRAISDRASQRIARELTPEQRRRFEILRERARARRGWD